MKTLTKMLIISVVCITAVTVSYISAELSFINSDGTGCVYDLASNVENNSNVFVYVDEWRMKYFGIPYIQKYESASFWTDELNANNETNTGAYFLNIGNPFIDGPKNGNFMGAESDDLTEILAAWNNNAHGVFSSARASVDPDDETDAGPIKVEM